MSYEYKFSGETYGHAGKRHETRATRSNNTAEKALYFRYAATCYELEEKWAETAKCYVKEFNNLIKIKTSPKIIAIALTRAANNFEKANYHLKAAEYFILASEYEEVPEQKVISLVRASNNYEVQGNLELAIKYLRESIKIQTNNHRNIISLTRLACCLAQDGKEDEAFEYFEKASDLAVGNIDQQKIIREAMIKHCSPISASTSGSVVPSVAKSGNPSLKLGREPQ